jgi:hypothetical protein
MDTTWMITAFVVIDALMERPGHRSDVRARVSDSEIVTIAVIVANSDRLYGSSHKDCYSIESTFTRNALQNKKTYTADAAQVGEQSNTPEYLKRLWFSTPGSTARLPRQRFADGQLLCRGRNAPRLSFPLRWCELYRWNPVPAHTASGVSSNIRRLPVDLHGADTMPFPSTYGRPRHPDTCGKRRLLYRIIDPFVNVQLSFSFPGVLVA